MGKHVGTQKSFRFSPEELDLLDRLAQAHGGFKPAVLAGLNLLAGANKPTRSELLRMLADELEAADATQDQLDTALDRIDELEAKQST